LGEGEEGGGGEKEDGVVEKKGGGKGRIPCMMLPLWRPKMRSRSRGLKMSRPITLFEERIT